MSNDVCCDCGGSLHPPFPTRCGSLVYADCMGPECQKTLCGSCAETSQERNGLTLCREHDMKMSIAEEETLG